MTAGCRAVAGIYDDAFGAGWSPPVFDYPTYRALSPKGAVCVIPRPPTGKAVLQVRLFYHVVRPPIPDINGRVGAHEWTWSPTPGWQTLQHVLPPGRGAARIRLWIPTEDEPWFEARVVEVRLLAPGDPRVHPREVTP